MSRDRELAKEALLIALGQRAQRLQLLDPEQIEAALSAPSEAAIRALREQVAGHEGLAFLSEALAPLSPERRERLGLLAEVALGVERPGRVRRQGRGGKRWQLGDAWHRLRLWFMVPVAVAAAIAVLIAWPRAQTLPSYALEAQIGDAAMLSPGPGSRSVSRSSLLQLVLRPPAVTRLRPAVLLFAYAGDRAGDAALRHVPADVAWSTDGSGRIRLPVAQAFPRQQGPARLLLVAAPSGTTAADAAARLRGEKSWPKTWMRYELLLDLAP